MPTSVGMTGGHLRRVEVNGGWYEFADARWNPAAVAPRRRRAAMRDYFSKVLRRNPVRDCAAAIMNEASWPERMNLAPISM